MTKIKSKGRLNQYQPPLPRKRDEQNVPYTPVHNQDLNILLNLNDKILT